MFTSSDLWKLGGLDPRTAPKVLPETGWEVPTDASEVLRSNEGHRSYTEFQQTAQWLGGQEVPHALVAATLKGALGSTTSKKKVIMVTNLTPYDGCLEKTLIALRESMPDIIPTSISVTPNSVFYNHVATVVKRVLVEATRVMKAISFTPHMHHCYFNFSTHAHLPARGGSSTRAA